MIRGIEEVDNFGGNNKTEGYTNMVDMGGICDACSAYADGADKVNQPGRKDAVVYKVTGSTHPDTSGLSSIIPLAFRVQMSYLFSVSFSESLLRVICRQTR